MSGQQKSSKVVGKKGRAGGGAGSANAGKDLVVAQSSGLLDAYTDASSVSSAAAVSSVSCQSKDESSPTSKPLIVSKKNKNKKKREQREEAERIRQISESQQQEIESQHVVLDSWEDIDAEATEAPTFVINPASIKVESCTSLVNQLEKMTITEKEANDKDNVTVALEQIQLTIKQVQQFIKEVPTIADNKQKPVKQSETCSNTEPSESKNEMEVPKVEKSKEEIKAEREAKKKAKAAARASKNKNVDVTLAKEEKKEEETQQKSKAELKAERRAKQEEQRAKKAMGGNKEPIDTLKVVSQGQPSSSGGKSHKVPDDIQADRASVEKKRAKRLASQQIQSRTQAQRKVMLFSHLHQYERECSLSKPYPIVGAHIHPAVMRLGLQYAEGTVTGSNARCVALLDAMKRVIDDYATPPHKELARDLDAKLKTYITFLKECRPLSVSMGNAIRFLKGKINGVKSSERDEDAKAMLQEAINVYVHHNIVLAAEQIAITACEKIRDGDVILTYGCSSLLRTVFKRAVEKGIKFRVIIADGRPRLEGREMARHMVNIGIHCTYVLISSVSYIISEVTKVFLGAHAVLANGCVMSRIGSSQVALVAKASNVPVLVCCETYKFTERVQTDSFVFNELGDPDNLVATGTVVNPLEGWRDLNSVCLLNLTYDVTPASLVDAIISEISVIPGTSVPVVLRLRNSELSC